MVGINVFLRVALIFFMNDMYSLWIRLFMNDVMNDVKVLYGSESS